MARKNTKAPEATSAAFIEAMYGKEFAGYLSLWSKQTKRTTFYTSSAVPKLLDDIANLQGTEDLYLGLSTQLKDVGPNKRGGVDSIVTFPGFFADLDFADDKQSDKTYPPNAQAVQQILGTFDYPPSLIQHSGNGAHAFWLLDAPFMCKDRKDRRRVQAASKAFQAKLVAHFAKQGYAIDSVGDTVRLYRVLGTFNHKSDPAKQVAAVQYDPQKRISLTDVEALGGEDGADKGAKERKDYPPANHYLIAKECAWYASVTGEGAAACDEPNWHAAASITRCCTDGEQVFLDYSAAHPGFSHREAQAKYDSTAKAGPRTCAAIKGALGNARFCNDCQHAGRIKSPVQLGHGYDAGKLGPIPLGYTNNGNYVLRDQVRQVILIASSQQLLSFQYQLGLAESGFWRHQFPSAKGLYASLQVGEALRKACLHTGPFDASKLRGRGVWMENGLVVENLGAPVPPGLKHTYLCFAPLKIDRTAKPEADRFLKLLQSLPWRNAQDAELFFGWLAVAPICGALNWRPHCFIYGPPNAGKTTAHNLASDILSPLCVSADGQSTEAGIRQSLGPDALPVIMDEFETGHNQRKQKSVMVLARSASSAESPVLRGTPEGQAVQFAIKTMFLWSAVNVAEMSAADQSRILMLELVAHGNSPEVGKQIEIERAHFSKLGPQWSGYMANLAPHVVAAIDLFRAELTGIDSRLRQNMATLLAGAFVALHGRVPSAIEAAARVAEMKPTTAHHGQAHDRDDAMECLEHLFGHMVRGSDDRADYPLGHYIGTELAAVQRGERGNHLRDSYRIMASHELKLYLADDHSGLLIRNQSPAVDRIFRDTRWAGGSWKKALGQIVGTFSLERPQPFPGVSGKHRSVGVPLHLIPEPIENPASKADF